MFETLADTRSMLADSGVSVYLGASLTVNCIYDQTYDEALDIPGRRSVIRIASADAASVSIGDTVTVTDQYTDPATVTDYLVRALETGQRTSLLILEVAP